QEDKKTRFLPSIVPLVLYHGAAAGTPPRQFKDLLQLQDSALAPYQLQFEYLLCNLSDLSARELRAGLASRLAMRALHNIFAENSRQGLRRTLALLAEISDKQSVTDLVEMILRYFVQVHPTLEEPMIQEALHHTGDQTLMETFIDRYIREGREQGMQQGEQLLLRRLLIRRFGPLPPWAGQHLETADCTQLEDWGDRLLDADSSSWFRMYWRTYWRHKSWKIFPMSFRSWPKMAFLRYFGMNTRWYLQYHLTWDWLCHSLILVSFQLKRIPQIKLHAGTAEPFRVSPPEAEVYLFELTYFLYVFIP
ncbi:MAG: DUF4351 domain-containing protein, partial [Gammaproteobacteria bacterium]|nr:DUF4351 domain-containing protein [Gammaproteobacteria bacterium]